MIFEELPGRWERDFPLQKLTTWKIGGPAEYVYWPARVEDVQALWQRGHSAGLELWFLGRGSNILVDDRGLPGITVVSSELQGVNWGDYIVRVEAGYSLARLAQETGDRGWSGLEFARGIPGTVGGAVVMNAGAHGGEIADSLVSVRVLDKAGEIREIARSELEFGYRESSLRGESWVLEAEFSFSPGNRAEILESMKAQMLTRKLNQPLDLPNAGSIFRNPPGHSAGRLIELAGWKGKRIGGAMVSDKHANFIVNLGGATAKDVLALIEGIQLDVLDKFKLNLQPEVQYLTPTAEGVE